MTNKVDNNPVLYIENLYKAYGDNVILDNIDLKVSKGAFVTVVGPSGCGKSTLLKLILGQEEKTSGVLDIDGQGVGYADEKRGIVYQKYSLFPNKTVLENVLFGRQLGKNKEEWKRDKKKITDEAMEYLNAVKLGEHSHKYPHELSGGMQQRVAVMQALIMKPKILLMDEPFGALDPGTREDIQVFLLEQQQKHNITVFFVTHDLEEAVFLGSRLLVVSQYYKDDRNLDIKSVSHGAKIVADHHIRHIGEPKESVKEKQSEEFGKLIASIRSEGFDQHHLQHVSQFNLKHANSFNILTDDELNK
jgi:NitT/TauT family transport system ATP-binding protein